MHEIDFRKNAKLLMKPAIKALLGKIRFSYKSWSYEKYSTLDRQYRCQHKPLETSWNTF